jgi:predicted nucleic acid-binding protein
MIVLDTNVLSELMRSPPDDRILAWLANHRQTELFTTAISEAEILFGIALLPEGRRRNALATAASATFREGFSGRILPFDRGAAANFAEIGVTRRKAGKPISQADGQIAAIARSQGAAIATRNVSDFEQCGIVVINPWMEP